MRSGRRSRSKGRSEGSKSGGGPVIDAQVNIPASHVCSQSVSIVCMNHKPGGVGSVQIGRDRADKDYSCQVAIIYDYS